MINYPSTLADAILLPMRGIMSPPWEDGFSSIILYSDYSHLFHQNCIYIHADLN